MITNASALIVPPAAPVPDPVTATNGINDIRGLKPPVALPNSWAWAAWILAALLLAILAAWAGRAWRKKTQLPKPAHVVPPHVRAKHNLQRALNLLSHPKEFCILVSNTIRIYLEEQFQFHAPDRTTEEFLLELQDTDLLSPDQKQSLGEFLLSCDLVKFAQFEPTEIALRELHDAACRLVDETQFEPLHTAAPPLASHSVSVSDPSPEPDSAPTPNLTPTRYA